MAEPFLVDDRERGGAPTADDLVEHLRALKVPAEKARLDVGDYFTLDNQGYPTIITRKAADLFTSLHSNHFSEELDKAARMVVALGGGKIFWLLEGVWACPVVGGERGMAYFRRDGNTRYSPHALHDVSPGSLPNLMVSAACAGVSLVWTADFHGVAHTLAAIYFRAQEGWPTHIMRGVQKPQVAPWQRDERVPRLMALWPRLSERRAMALLREFKSIIGVLQAAEAGLVRVPGIGKKGLDTLRRIALE